MQRMFPYGTTLPEVDIAALVVILDIGIYSKIAQQLHHKYKMKIGKTILKIVDTRVLLILHRQFRQPMEWAEIISLLLWKHPKL